MKKLLFKINALFAAAAILLSGAAVHKAHAEPAIDIWASKKSVSVAPNENFTLSVQFSCEYYNNESKFTLSVNSGGLKLISGSDGTATPGKMYAYTFSAPTDSPKMNYISFTVNYDVVEYYSFDEDSPRVSGSKTVTVPVEVVRETDAPVPPILENIGFDKEEVEVGEAFTVFADVINEGSGKISDAVLTLRDKNGKQIARKWIGGVDEDAAVLGAELKVSGLDTAGAQTVTVYLDYVDSKKKSAFISKNLSITVKAASENNGKLKIQSVTPPIEAAIDDYTEVFFTVTNPTTSAVKNVEAYLYDENDNEITSLWIGTVDANTTMPLSMKFPIKGKAGSRTYRLTVTNNKDITINSSFSFSAVAEEDMNTDEKPANLKIQAVNAPSKMYCGTRTSVPFTLVNAGKGTAYNVEVYVTDENGVELTRKYIGLIPPSGSFDGEIKLKFDESDEYNLTFCAVCESFNGAVSSVSESFEQRVVTYRASIEDVTGYDWIYNGTATIEFAVLNAGTDTMYNVNAELTNENGDVFGKTFVGTIAAGEKKERVRFRNVYIDSMGESTMPLVINVTYENVEMQEFPLSYSMMGNFFFDMGGGGDFIKEPYPGEGEMLPEGMEEPKPGITTLFIIIGAAVLVVVIIVVIVVIAKKKKKRSDDDDIDYFLSQLKLSAPPAAPVATNTPTYPTSSVSDSETELKR